MEDAGKPQRRLCWGLSSIALFALTVLLPILWIMLQANMPRLAAGCMIVAAVGAPICGAAIGIVGLYRDRRRYLGVIGLVLNILAVGFWCYWGFAYYVVSNLAT